MREKYFTLRLKADWFADFIAATPDQLTDRLTSGLKAFFANQPLVAA